MNYRLEKIVRKIDNFLIVFLAGATKEEWIAFCNKQMKKKSS